MIRITRLSSNGVDKMMRIQNASLPSKIYPRGLFGSKWTGGNPRVTVYTGLISWMLPLVVFGGNLHKWRPGQRQKMVLGIKEAISFKLEKSSLNSSEFSRLTTPVANSQTNQRDETEKQHNNIVILYTTGTSGKVKKIFNERDIFVHLKPDNILSDWSSQRTKHPDTNE